MKDFAGTPGTITGLLLRIAQFMFAAGAVATMASSSSFSRFTAFCYLIASMGLQVIWSLSLALMDAYALAKKIVIHNHILVSLFVIGDWVTASLSLAAASASAGITVLYIHDIRGCTIAAECFKYQIAVAFAFLSWLTVFISSLIMFWLLAAS
ncbi:CASP-like protein 5B3 [Chenopodium quinoa]|uniref:CASP-like protein 5B3 n=1 Tax=Chenopodium quinoa TaxID=63459 RepID=UPI000B778D5A|nr:CASP-like protein 5B3 [Chenopodium quinoa]